MGQDVFISYKSEEFQEADWVRQQLESGGISCWMAPNSITGGASYATEIPQAIRGCRVFVLILSRRAQLSQWVPKELDQAINCGKIIMPFMLENCPLEDDFSFYLSNVQRYPAYEGREAAMQRMLREIRTLLGCDAAEPPAEAKKEPAKTPAPAAKEKKTAKVPKESADKKAGKKKWMIPVGVLLAAVLAIVLLRLGSNVTIAGTRYDAGITSLRLKEVQLTPEDLSTIAGLKKLGILTMEECAFTGEDLTGLTSATVWELGLPGCTLTEAQTESLDLTGFPKLRSLDISGIAAWQQLPQLPEGVTQLDISRSGISSLEGVQRLSGLSRLAAADTPVTDLTPLATCQQLERADISDTAVTDLTPLESCGKLQLLKADETPLTTLQGLETCIELRCISLKNAQLTDISGLRNTTLLEYVQFSGNRLEDVSVLAGSKDTLERLYLDGLGMESLDWLRGAAALRYLSVNDNRLETLDFLEESPALEGLSAANNAISSAAPLEGMANLKELVLRDNPLSGAPELHLSGSGPVVDLRHTNITGLTLASEERIRLLDISHTAVTDIRTLTEASYHDLILSYQATMDRETLGACNTYQFTVLDCPLDRQVAVRTALENRVEYATELPVQSDELLSKTMRGEISFS